MEPGLHDSQEDLFEVSQWDPESAFPMPETPISLPSSQSQGRDPEVIYETEPESEITEVTEVVPEVDAQGRITELANITNDFEDRTRTAGPLPSRLTSLTVTGNPDTNGGRTPVPGPSVDIHGAAHSMPDNSQVRTTSRWAHECRSSHERLVAVLPTTTSSDVPEVRRGRNATLL